MNNSGVIHSNTTIIVRNLKSLGPIFYLTVAIPCAIAIIYFGLIASDIYTSESRFVVRSPEKSAGTGLGILLKSAGFSNSGDSAIAAEDYVKSRDALAAINSDGLVEKAYTRSGVSIFDKFNPLGWDGSFEALFQYYNKRIQVGQSGAAGITTLTVQAYDPGDAFEINKRLLVKAEQIINRLNNRGHEDLINFTKSEVADAKKSATDTAIALASFRNRSGIVDPLQQSEVQLQMTSKLQDELIATKGQLFQLRAFAPGSAQIPVLEAKEKSLTNDIAKEMGKLAGGDGSLAAANVEYQRLALEDQFAQKQLAAALASLSEAENEARRKQAYVETVVSPHKPDEALGPRRIRGILTTLVLGLVAWAIASMLIVGIREHRD